MSGVERIMALIRSYTFGSAGRLLIIVRRRANRCPERPPLAWLRQLQLLLLLLLML